MKLDQEEQSEDFRMTLEEFVLYQQKALTKFAQYWTRNAGAREPLQEPETWQNLFNDYCDFQFQYDVASWPLNPFKTSETSDDPMMPNVKPMKY